MSLLFPLGPSGKDGEQSSTVRKLDTTEAYDLWSEVYDTDGNFLQALDTIEMQSLLPQMVSKITSPRPWKIVDLGCGTGRNTSQLLNVQDATIIGLDASRKMLDVAELKLSGRILPWSYAPREPQRFELRLYDLLNDSGCPIPNCALDADALISTLVLEHIPLLTFFRAIHEILKPAGIALVTNMHSEMGKISQAGFVDPSTGDKVQPQSFIHRLEDVIAEAERQGLEVVGDVQERSVDEDMSQRLGQRAKKWIGVTVWFGILFRKKG